MGILKWIVPTDEEAEQKKLARQERLKEIAMQHIEAATARMVAADEAGNSSEASDHSDSALCWWQTVTGTG